MEEKREKPSQRKLKKARERGEVAVSAELASALVLAGGVFLLWAFASVFSGRLQQIFTDIFSNINTLDSLGALKSVISKIAFPLIAFLLLLCLCALAAWMVQTGLLWGRPKGRRRSKTRPLFTLLKVVVIGAIGYLTLRDVHSTAVISIVFTLLVKVSLALVILGVGDFIYQRWKFSQKMRMTAQELKEEQRETEGQSKTRSRQK